MRQIFSFLAILLFFVSCNSPTHKQWKVGVDPSWYPLNFKERQVEITAFSTELLSAIGKEENLSFTKITVSWDDLLQGLHKGEYDAILSSMPPYLFNQKQFAFSEPYLLLGPVLVVRESEKIKDLSDLNKKEIAVIKGSTNDELLQKSKGVIIRYYDSIPEMLNAIVNQTIDGALVDNLSAHSYLNDLYRDQLKIATEPLTQEALRLIALNKQAPELIQKFNKGLEHLKKNGSYQKLQKKWGLFSNSENATLVMFAILFAHAL